MGLQVLAATCECWAVDIGTTRTPAGPASSYQATSAAIGVVHNGINMAGGLLAQRMRSTAADLLDASRNYSGAEDNSVSEIRDVTTSL